MIIILIIFVFIQYVCSLNSVFIHQAPLSGEYQTLTCTISGLDSDKFSPHLYCPLTESRMCYSNCTKECKFMNGKCNALEGLEAIHGCKYTYHSSDHIQIQYFLHSSSINNNKGEWYCSYAGVNSKGLSISSKKNIEKSTKKEIINEDDPLNQDKRNMDRIITPKIINVQKKEEEKNEIEVPKGTSKVKEIKQEEQSNDDISFKAFITKFRVVIGILCLFVISVLLNIIFCIRDSMIKYYIDNLKNNVRSHKALLFCVCQTNSVTTDKHNQTLSQECNFYKDDYNFSRNNIYEFDSQLPLLMQQRNAANSARPSPSVSRSRSFQYGPPVIPQVQFDPNYMSVQRSYSQYSPFNYGQHIYPYYAPTTSISLNGSDTTHEDVIREGQYQVDHEGKPILVKVMQKNNSSKPQNVDLINDCGQTHISQSDLSKNEE